MDEEPGITGRDVEPNATDKSFALGAHLACWVPLLPLGLYWLSRKRGSLYMRFHALQATYWQFMAWFGGAAAVLLGAVIPCAFVILKPLAWIVATFGPLWAIYAGYRAFRGQWYCYPLAGWSAQVKLGVPSILIEKPTDPVAPA